MDPTNHFSLDYLAEFVDGRLPPQAQVAVSTHLNTSCPECSERVNFLRRFRRAGQTESWPIPPQKVHRKVVQAFRPTARQFPRRLRPRLGQVLTAALAVAIILIGLMWLAAPPAAYAASIREVSGQVEFRLGGQAVWRSAAAGQKLLPGSEIRTSAHSQTALVFPNGGRLQLSENTHVVLNTLTHLNKLWQIALLQDTGQTDSQINPQTGLYLLQTPAGDIAANGTRFGVRVEADGKTFINVREGSVTATTDAGEISIEAGQSAQITLNAIPMVAPSTTSNDTPTIMDLTSPTASGTQTNHSSDTPTQTLLPTQTEVTNEENQDSPNSSDGDGQHP
jgi:ferric-dicitrate binding protein FerR (iron transport regulator)